MMNLKTIYRNLPAAHVKIIVNWVLSLPILRIWTVFPFFRLIIKLPAMSNHTDISSILKMLYNSKNFSVLRQVTNWWNLTNNSSVWFRSLWKIFVHLFQDSLYLFIKQDSHRSDILKFFAESPYKFTISDVSIISCILTCKII